MARMTKDNVDKLHMYDISIETRTIFIGSIYMDEGDESGVDAHLAERFHKNMHILESKSSEPITIIINNPGGDWNDGIGMYDAIEKSDCHITIKVKGKAMSMASIILQAADHRVMSEHSRLMIHSGHTGFSGHSKSMEEWAIEERKTHKEMEDIYLNRIREKKPKFTRKQLNDMLHFDKILDAKEAIEHGLADEVE